MGDDHRGDGHGGGGLRLIGLGLACVTLASVFVLSSARAEESVTVDQFARRHSMKVVDDGTHLTLEGPLVRMRIYPGTNEVVLHGEKHKLKDPILRAGGDVLIPLRPARFLDRELGTARGEILAARRKFRVQPVETVAVAPQTRPIRRREVEVVPLPPALPKPRAEACRVDPRWVPSASERRWKWIVIHHSDDLSGNAAKYDRVHREVNGWDSLGYHFVIGNGSLSRDGEVEVGPRWSPQKHGAHARNPELGDNRYNEQGIGICLVGNFDEDDRRPSSRQLDELVRLTRWLMDRYDIPPSMVVRHQDCCRTQCPGRHFPWGTFTRRLAPMVAVPAEPVAQR